MKIIVTGSLGHISKPLTRTLLDKGHQVTVISSKSERQGEIEAMGAGAAIGSMTDSAFLAKTFAGADAVYAMEAIGYGSFFDHKLDVIEAIREIAENYRQAIQQSGVKRVVHLSSIGAHTDKDSGLLAFHYHAENILRQLPAEVAIKFMRPVGFYYNMSGFIQMIKTQGAIVQNYNGDEKEPWVSTNDIAAVIAEEIEKPFAGRTIRYIASDEVSPNEVARILGEAIGKPMLQWRAIPDAQFLAGLVAAGMNPKTAEGYMKMNAARRGGVLYQDYQRNRPVLSPTKVTDFAKEFAAIYNKK